MSSTPIFDRLWIAAYQREYPILQVAARLASGMRPQEINLVRLFERARMLYDAEQKFITVVDSVDRTPRALEHA